MRRLMRRLMRPPPARFFALLALLTLAACAAWATAVLASGSYAEARALDGITRHLAWHIRAFGPGDWRTATGGLAALAGLLGLAALAALARCPAEARALGRELGGSLLAHGRGLARLPRHQQRLALAGLAGLTALRLYFSLSQPAHAEEIASYLWFVRRGLLAVGAYYPVPNNHVLANVVAWGFSWLHPGFWFALRLPVLLTATVVTTGLFALGRRVAGFWAALLGTGLFAGLQLSWYFAAAGRGYWLFFGWAALVLFATLALGTGTRRPRAAWAALLLGSLGGLYTMPAFAYPALAAWAWLGASAWQSGGLRRPLRRFWSRALPALLALLGVGATLGAGTALLYAPLLLVSGWKALAGNGYVAAQAAGAFWPALPAYVQLAEGMVAGQGTVGGLLTLAVAGAARYALRGPLPRLLLWWLLAPYLWLLVQRVLPPERVLLYKSEALFLLAGLLVVAGWRRLPATAQRPASAAVALAAAAFVGYQLYQVERLNRTNRRPVAAYRAAWQWLARQPAGAALVPDSRQRLYFHFYACTASGPARVLDAQPLPGRHYRYRAAPGRAALAAASAPAALGVPPAAPAFANEQVTFWALP